jgi:hypothetical protein
LFGTLTLPLLWVAAWRWLGRRPAWLAVLLLALSPLHVYYAQEARMYTLLTFLGLLSSYLLLRWLDSPSPSLRSPLAWGYALATAAALHTHYFAFFLMATQALYVLYRWWNQLRSARPVSPDVLTAILLSLSISVLYLPWLPFPLTRYGVDTSYWPGALGLGEVARKLFIAFSLGETLREGVGFQLAIGYGLILLSSLISLVRRSRQSKQIPYNTHYVLRFRYHDSLIFLLLYFLVPVALVLLLTLRTPKFNPRYAMLASPAFILLIAGGLSSLFAHQRSAISDQRSATRDQESGTTFHVLRFTFSPRGTYGYVSRLLAAAALVYILVTSVYSLSNWFAPYRTNQFNKADFRITAQLVRERIRPDETVLLSSGHMFPAWAYYYGWQGWQRLPDIEILDVNAALDLSVGDTLGRLLQGKRGVWLVRWQNEVTDPFDVLPLYLGSVGTQDDYGQFWHMELFHYQLPPDARFDLASFTTQPAEVDFGGQVKLLGLRQISSNELVLFWQAVADIGVDYTIFVHLLGAEGETLANADHLPPRPTHEWRPGQAIPDRVKLPLPPGLPPGDYWIKVGLYDRNDPGLPRLPLEDGSGDGALLPLHLEANALE